MKALNTLYTKMNDLVNKYHTDPAGLAARLVDILDEAFNIGFSVGDTKDCGFPDDPYDDDNYQVDYPDPMNSADEPSYIEKEREAWYDSLGY